MIHAIIVDDEPDGQDILFMLLQKYCTDVQVVARVSSVKEAVDVLNSRQVNLVFLDVHMGATTGFDVLNGVVNRAFEVIFVTAHDKYAIKAIKFGAADYVLKPIDFNELVIAVARVREKLSTGHAASPPAESAKLKIQARDRVLYVSTDDIVWLGAAGNYTEIHTGDKQKYMVAKTLGEYEEKLTSLSNRFVRINRNAIVHIQAIKSFGKGTDAFIELTDNTVLPISRRRRSEVMDKIKGM